MDDVVEKIAICIERGKASKESSFPPDMQGQEGVEEITVRALEAGMSPDDLLKGCMLGMDRIGRKFAEKKAYVPNLCVAAHAMKVVMKHLQPYLESGKIKRKGIIVIGTVRGDLHDIGKNLVSMAIRGGGYEVVDLGIDVPTEKFLQAISEHPGCFAGLSALLTTTMKNMETTVKAIRENHPGVKILIGGAPITHEFCREINADFYSPDFYDAITFLNKDVDGS
jgi:methanogenic corrinoid protein MtbC1